MLNSWPLAKEKSADIISARNGGDMGWLEDATIPDELKKAIDLNRPACQDTGEIMFFVKVGSRFPLSKDK